MKKGKERPSTSVAPPPSSAKKVEKKGQLGAAVLASVIAATPVHRVPPMEDTEGLVLDTIDWILDETFLFQIQYERLEKQMHFGIEAMASSIISTLRMGCYIDYDAVVSVECCEDEPRADSVDRHAVQALPKKEVSAHPQRLYESPNGVPFQRAISLRSMSEKSSLPPRNTASSAAPQPRRRGSAASDTFIPQEQPMVFRIPAKVDYFDKETKAWRIKCMTELTSSKQKKAKWGKVSVLRRALGQREYDVTETTVVCDTTTIRDGDNDPDTMTIDSAPVTTLDTVRTIPDDTPVDQDTTLLLLHQPSPKEDTPADDKPPRARRRHGAAEVKTPKRTVKSSWFYEKLSVKGEFKQEKAYEPHVMELQRETFAQSIELNTGVSLVQGVSKYLGPNRRETMSAMSRQGFQNHLRMVVGASSDSNGRIWDGPNKVQLRSLPPPTTVNLEVDVFDGSNSMANLRPGPQLTSPRHPSMTIDTANTRSSPSLNAPNNDKYASTPSRVKTQTTSPAVRVRVSPLRADTANARPQPREQYVTHGDSVGVPEIPTHRRRPATAIGALLANSPTSSMASTSPSTKSISKLKYIREFPSPKAEVVTVLKAPDDCHRMAWLT
ncbi:hypothetical protein H257_18889 [Aphanomyces astaci]|uniref:Uncharacterized protein n=1 Tax=Aphanomyces astaci TaxID=112090 RepID=W4F9M3_APHAT|nr:hypothetical protein H257_18889 [Aphanomyces astaci]ETV64190.1 hypothetical protein H257_18889 [Aphanomyces astaci]|eukprot:XP_009846328.1 hypothetical protein H257_18889 [Aphanomyces astaci]